MAVRSFAMSCLRLVAILTLERGFARRSRRCCVTMALSPDHGVKRVDPLTRLGPSDCRALRESVGWSREQLARTAGVAALTVLTFELGRRKPREETLIALRRAFRNAGLIARDPGLPPACEAVVCPHLGRAGDPAGRQAAPQLP
jgi:DNA-binding XRE family transcriptional regulator